MEEKLVIVLGTGTLEKLQMAAMLTSVVATFGTPVRIFVTMGAIPAFKKGLSKEERARSESIVGQAILEKNAPYFIDVLKQAKGLGDVKLYACGLAMDVLGWEVEDLEEGLFDEMVGITEFLGIAEGGKIMVI